MPGKKIRLLDFRLLTVPFKLRPMNRSMAKIILWLSIPALILCGCDFFDSLHRSVSEKLSATGSAPAAEDDPEAPVLFDGQTRESVQQVLGEPDGILNVGTRTVLLYSGESLEFIEDKWVNFQPDIREKIEDSKKALAKQAKAAKSKPKKPASTTPPPVPVKAPPAPVKTQPAAAPAANSGTGLYSSLTVPGKITVVDFYATWCGPCKQIAPVLDNMVRGKPDVTLRKVDIGNWGSSTAKKYNITSVPNIRVFDKKGRMVGSPTSNPQQIAQNIEQARKNL
jgi:thioredoxin 1